MFYPNLKSTKICLDSKMFRCFIFNLIISKQSWYICLWSWTKVCATASHTVEVQWRWWKQSGDGNVSKEKIFGIQQFEHPVWSRIKLSSDPRGTGSFSRDLSGVCMLYQGSAPLFTILHIKISSKAWMRDTGILFTWNPIFLYYKHERVLARFVATVCFFRTIPNLYSSTLAEGNIKEL